MKQYRWHRLIRLSFLAIRTHKVHVVYRLRRQFYFAVFLRPQEWREQVFGSWNQGSVGGGCGRKNKTNRNGVQNSQQEIWYLKPLLSPGHRNLRLVTFLYTRCTRPEVRVTDFPLVCKGYFTLVGERQSRTYITTCLIQNSQEVTLNGILLGKKNKLETICCMRFSSNSKNLTNTPPNPLNRMV